MRDLEPESGVYMNEADPTEPEWRKAKFGGNYEQLLQVKRKWDERGVFWCKQCIGDEEQWDSGGLEDGVGQGSVRLCWKR